MLHASSSRARSGMVTSYASLSRGRHPEPGASRIMGSRILSRRIYSPKGLCSAPKPNEYPIKTSACPSYCTSGEHDSKLLTAQRLPAAIIDSAAKLPGPVLQREDALITGSWHENGASPGKSFPSGP